MTIGSDDNRDSRISKALNTSRFVESLLLSENPRTPQTPLIREEPPNLDMPAITINGVSPRS